MTKNKILDNRPLTIALCINPSSVSAAISIERKPKIKNPNAKNIIKNEFIIYI